MSDTPNVPTFVPFRVYYELEDRLAEAARKIAELEARNGILIEENKEMRSAVRSALALFDQYDRVMEEMERGLSDATASPPSPPHDSIRQPDSEVTGRRSARRNSVR